MARFFLLLFCFGWQQVFFFFFFVRGAYLNANLYILCIIECTYLEGGGGGLVTMKIWGSNLHTIFSGHTSPLPPPHCPLVAVYTVVWTRVTACLNGADCVSMIHTLQPNFSSTASHRIRDPADPKIATH